MAKGNKMSGFIHYNNTKAAFIAAGHPATYNDAIVFIAGDATTSSCIYTHGKYFATADEAEKYLATLPYFKGIKIGNTTYNAANGGGYLALAANDPATLTINTNSDGVVIGLTDTVKNTISGAVQSAKGDSKYISAGKNGTEITVSANVEDNLATSASADKLPTAAAAKSYVDTKIDALEVEDTAVAGQYVSAVSESNGKISVSRDNLPTLTEGTVNGEVVYGDTAVKVHGLKSAAYTEASAYATSAQGALADSAIQGITAGDYISVSGTGTTKTVAAKVKKISTAATAKQGFADALDVKTELGTLAETISGVNGRVVTALDQLTVWTGKNENNYDKDETKSIRNISAEEVAKIVAGADASYDTLKEIADWIKSDSTGAAKMATDIAKNKEDIADINEGFEQLSDIVGDSNGEGTVFSQLTSLAEEVSALGGEAGSIANQIKTEIEKLDVSDEAVAGEYVSSVSETDGKISVSRATLPTYTLATGTNNGTVKFNNTDVAVKGLGTAAYTASTAYATSTQGGYANSALQSVSVATPNYAEFGNKTGNNGAKTQALSIKTVNVAAASSTSTGLADAYNVQTFVTNVVDGAFTWEELS